MKKSLKRRRHARRSSTDALVRRAGASHVVGCATETATVRTGLTRTTVSVTRAKRTSFSVRRVDAVSLNHGTATETTTAAIIPMNKDVQHHQTKKVSI